MTHLVRDGFEGTRLQGFLERPVVGFRGGAVPFKTRFIPRCLAAYEVVLFHTAISEVEPALPGPAQRDMMTAQRGRESREE